MFGGAGQAGGDATLLSQEDERRMKFSYAVAEMIAMPPHTKQLLLQVITEPTQNPFVICLYLYIVKKSPLTYLFLMYSRTWNDLAFSQFYDV